MNNKIAHTGNKGNKDRFDCFITLEIRNVGGIDIEIQRNRESASEQSIHELATDMLNYYEISDASLKIEDNEALLFVIAARIEAAIKHLKNTDKEYLFPVIKENQYVLEKDRFRFSHLYVPGNTPKMIMNAGKYHPYSIALDLEDSVDPVKKQEAGILIRNALRGIDLYGAEKMVRINPFPRGLDDLKYIVSNNVHAILIPKCEDGAHVRRIEDETEKIRSSEDIKEPVYYMPIIESAMGVEKAFEIATSSDNLIALALGLEDYTADIGAERTLEAKESFYARTRVVNACKAAQIQAIESVFSDVADKEGLRTTLKESKSLGFDGMGCIHPDQIDIIHESFTPGKEEIEQAIKIVNAYDEAQKKGRGVSSHENKMIDLPVVKRAKKIIELAEYLGLVGVKRRE